MAFELLNVFRKIKESDKTIDSLDYRDMLNHFASSDDRVKIQFSKALG